MARRGEKGLTLIEVLVGLVLLGALVAMLSGALRLGLLGRETVDERAEWLDEVRVSQSFIRRYIEAARPVVWVNERRLIAAYDGRRETVSFMATMPGWRHGGGLYLVRIGREGDALVMTRRITSGGNSGFDFTEESERTILASGVARLEFSYFGQTPPNDETPRWHDEWRDQTLAPKLLRLELDYLDPARKSWPVLVVNSMIGPQPR